MRVIILVVTVLGFTVGLRAQEAPARLLEKAVFAERSEGDLGRALEIYARVARDEQAGAALRAEAQLRKALVEGKLGRGDAARASLTAAAKGEGEAAERARLMLERGSFPQDEDWQVSGRIHRAIAKLYAGDTAEEGVSDLQLIGEAAVPPLAEAMRNEKSDIAFLGRGVAAMLRIGGQRVAKWFSAVVGDPDTIYRRTVLDRLVDLTRKTTASELGASLREEDLIALLADPDLDVAAHALTLLERMESQVGLEKIVAFFDRCDANRLASAVSKLRGLRFDQRIARDPEQKEQVLDILVALMQRGDGRLARQVESTIFGLSGSLGDDFWRYWFEFASRAPADIEGMFWRGQASHGGPLPDFELAQVLPYMRRLSAEEYARFRGLDQASRQGSRIVAMIKSATSLLQRKNGGRLEDVPPALEMIALAGPDPELAFFENLVRNSAQPEHLPRAVALVEYFAEPTKVAWAMSRLRLEPEHLDIAPVLDYLRRRAATTAAGNEGEFVQGEIGQFIRALVRREDPENLKEIMGLLDTDPRFYLPVCEHMTKIGEHSAREHLLTLVARGDEGQLAASARHLAFQKLLESGDERAIPLLIAAARAGLQFGAQYLEGERTRTYPSPSAEAFGLGGLDAIAKRGVWSGEQLARIAAGVLESGSPRHWADLGRLYARGSSSWGVLPREVRALVEERVLDTPSDVQKMVLRAILPGGVLDAETLVPAILARPELGLAEAAIAAIPAPYTDAMRALVLGVLADSKDDDLIEAAIGSVRAAREVELAAEVRNHLSSANERVRWETMETLFALLREEALPETLVLAKDPSSAIREALCDQLALIPDRRSVPVLIELLKDRDQAVRSRADAALRQIQFYFEQKDRWDKWLKGVGLESGNAAEALLEQAAPGQPKEQRLAAIASLGTLGVPETLPVLIGWMKDADPAIAAAAKAAVAKINGH